MEELSYNEKRLAFINSGRPLPEKKKYSIPKKSVKRVEKEKQQAADKTDNALEIWFKEREKDIIDSGETCWGCGAKIYKDYFRHATAHILEKKTFISVRTHPLNFLILGASCGCHNKTHRLDTFSKMPIFKEACERFKQFEPFITEKNKLLNTFKELVDEHSPYNI